jgi:4-hydroxy-3-polyprenylbenzoate decarboxylase
MEQDLRDWLAEMDRMGELKVVEGADWNLEIGCVTALYWGKRDAPALLFDNIKGYPPGYRVVTGSTSTPSRVQHILGLPSDSSDLELIAVLEQKLSEWAANLDNFQAQEVKSGPVLKNVRSGDEVDLLKFPVPKWHEGDGGRYIGTGDAVITRDPDTGEVNVGSYRMMVHDKKTCGLFIAPSHHGKINQKKYFARGEACPVAVSLGNHPLEFRVASQDVPYSEYSLIGAIRGTPVKVITEEITGLPIPADSEIVIAGWCPPGETMPEGPFGEWTGYYGGGQKSEPIMKVERIYYRDDPILQGCPPGRSPNESSYFRMLVKSALMQHELRRAGITDIRGVWVSEIGSGQLVVVSIKQRYAGHAKRAALIASQTGIAAHQGRYVIVVDEDIDPTNIQDVLWALCFRSDPEKDIDVIRRTASHRLDPLIPKTATAYFDSRGIIDACKPYDWIDEFPKAVEYSRELIDRVKGKWQDLG